MREKVFLYSGWSGLWKSVIHATHARSCTQPQHCHSPRSTSCCCVLSETQPHLEDKSASIHRQKFPPVNWIQCSSYACLSTSAARGFTSHYLFFSSGNPVASSISTSLSQRVTSHTHILLFSPPSLGGWTQAGKAEFALSSTLGGVHRQLVAWLMQAGVWELTCLSSKLQFGQLTLWRWKVWFLCQIRGACCRASSWD